MYKKVKLEKDEGGASLEIGYVIRKSICIYTLLQKTTPDVTHKNATRITRAIKNENPATDFKEMRYFELKTAISYGIKGVFIHENDFQFDEWLGVEDSEPLWRTTYCPNDALYVFGDRFKATGNPTQRGLSTTPGKLNLDERHPQSITFNR